MIELTGQDGHKIAINPAAIWHIRTGSGEQTAIYAASGAAIFVLEPYAEVLALCRREMPFAAGQQQGDQTAKANSENKGAGNVGRP